MTDTLEQIQTAMQEADSHWFAVIDELIPEDEPIPEADTEQESALLSMAEFQLAHHYVGPLLEAHSGWGWRDAVEWMKANGGVPKITGAMITAKIEMLRGVERQ